MANETTCKILIVSVHWVAFSTWDLWWMQWHWLTFVSELFGFPPICVIPPMIRTRISFIYHRRYVILVVDKVSLDKALIIRYSRPGLNSSWRPVVFFVFAPFTLIVSSPLFVPVMYRNYYKIVKLLKSFKIVTVAPTYFGFRKPSSGGSQPVLR